MEKPRFMEMQMSGVACLLPRRWRMLLAISLMLVSSGCAAFKEWKYLPATKAEERSVYVVSHGWHTGVVLSQQDLGNELAFVTEYLPPGRYYEFGWGEAEFYQAGHVTPFIFLRAAFWRNPSVMHVVSVPVAPAQYFSGSDLVELNLSETGLEQLKGRLRASFKYDETMHPYPLKRGLYGASRFFKGENYYVITNTCNSWTAKILESGGVPMDTVFTLRAASVIRQAKDAKEEYLKLRPFGKLAPQSP